MITKKPCPINVGVIGIGPMGNRHCRVYSNLHNVQFVGICDVNPVAGQEVAHKFGVTYFRHLDDLLAQVDAVSLAAPTSAHFELAMHCLDRGVHVLIEKPIAATLEQAESLVKSAKKSGFIIQVGHIERFNPTYIELTHVLDNMHIAALNLRRLSAFDASNTDVDVVLDLMIHDLDLVLNLIGDAPLMINACGLSVFSDTIDHATVQLCNGTGPMITLTASRITEHKVRTIEATTLEAFVEANLLNKTINVHRRTIGEYLSNRSEGVKYRQESIVECIQVPAFEPLFLELEHFVNCIITNTTPKVSASDGYQALKLASEIQANIKQHLIHINKQARVLPEPVLA